MTLALVCSSLEPGRDGVGDYSRLLAGALQRQGCGCCVLALNDALAEAPAEGTVDVDGVEVSTLRLPAKQPRAERLAIARGFLARHEPEWISLQFVCYGWHPRGLVAGWGAFFDALAGDRKRHLMMHEVWKGEHVGSPCKLRLLAATQRFWVLRLLRRWRPQVIHTHVPVFAAMLAKAGFSADLLPLFNNVPIATHEDAWLLEELRRRETFHEGAAPPPWLIGFFGSLHPEWKPEPFFTTLRSVAQTTGRRVILLSLGDMRGGEPHWQALSRAYPHFTFVNLGRRSAAEVSQYLQALDFAVATTSWKLMPKSSAAATMLDHGLSVVVTRDDWRWRGGPNPDPPPHPRLILASADLERQLLRGLPKEEPRSTAPGVAARLLTALRAASPE